MKSSSQPGSLVNVEAADFDADSVAGDAGVAASAPVSDDSDSPDLFRFDSVAPVLLLSDSVLFRSPLSEFCLW